MKSWVILLTVPIFGCATAGRRANAPAVSVYEADAKAPLEARRLPDGCHLLSTSGPIDQMESERADDPYRRERRETAERGGNVLLALSETRVHRPGTDCPSNDVSPDCIKAGQSWYRVSFEEYACSAEAAGQLASLPVENRHGGITILFGPPAKAPATESKVALTPAELKAKIVAMMEARVGPDVMLAFVRGQRLSRRLSAEEIIDWTRSGIPDAVIEAAASH